MFFHFTRILRQLVQSIGQHSRRQRSYGTVTLFGCSYFCTGWEHSQASRSRGRRVAHALVCSAVKLIVGLIYRLGILVGGIVGC